MSNSVAAVMSTPELLMLILSYNSPQDLLTFKSVNHTWCHVINTTKAIQENLFYRPAPSSKTLNFNPLLRRMFPMFFQSNYWVDALSMQENLERGSLSTSASFRNMLLFPVECSIPQIKVTEESHCRAGYRQRHGVIEPPNPITMGTVWDLTMDWCAQDPNHSFILRWRRDLFAQEQAVQREEARSSRPKTWREWFRQPWTTRQRDPEPEVIPRRPRLSPMVYDFCLGVGRMRVLRFEYLEIVLFRVKAAWFGDIELSEEEAAVSAGLRAALMDTVAEKMDVKYNCTFEEAPNTAHPLRLPKGTLKYRVGVLQEPLPQD